MASGCHFGPYWTIGQVNFFWNKKKTSYGLIYSKSVRNFSLRMLLLTAMLLTAVGPCGATIVIPEDDRSYHPTVMDETVGETSQTTDLSTSMPAVLLMTPRLLAPTTTEKPFVAVSDNESTSDEDEIVPHNDNRRMDTEVADDKSNNTEYGNGILTWAMTKLWRSKGEDYRSKGNIINLAGDVGWQGDWSRRLHLGYPEEHGHKTLRSLTDSPEFTTIPAARYYPAYTYFGTTEGNSEATITVPISDGQEDERPAATMEDRYDEDNDIDDYGYETNYYREIDTMDLLEKLSQATTRGALHGALGMIGDRNQFDSKPGLVFLPKLSLTVRPHNMHSRSDTVRQNKRVFNPVIIPRPITLPIALPPKPKIIRMPQPFSLKVPHVPVALERTFNVPIKNGPPYPFEKPLSVQPIKRIDVPKIKPFHLTPVPLPIFRQSYFLFDRDER